MRRKKEALAEADKFIAANGATALLAAQRGYLRRDFRNMRGALEDFNAALKSTALTSEQRHNINRAINEIKYSSSRPAGFAGAPIRTQKLDALMRAGRSREAIAEADRLIASGYTRGWVYAQRGFARRAIDDLPGAVSDFDMALGKGDLDAKVRTNIAYGRTETLARWAEREGRTDDAIEAYRTFTVMEPSNSEAWYSYGYAMIKRGRKVEGADALRVGLQAQPRASVAIDAANQYVLTNAPMASMLFRQAIDLSPGGNSIERERLRNEVVNADASVQTSIGYGGIGSRPAASGGRNDVFAAETRVRFDGRYLASVPGLEFVARGQTSKDEVGLRETELGCWFALQAAQRCRFLCRPVGGPLLQADVADGSATDLGFESRHQSVSVYSRLDSVLGLRRVWRVPDGGGTASAGRARQSRFHVPGQQRCAALLDRSDTPGRR